jgi:hypothetical protein
MLSNYQPELDITPHLNAEGITFYQRQIRILLWIVKLGHLNSYTPVALLSSYFT